MNPSWNYAQIPNSLRLQMKMVLLKPRQNSFGRLNKGFGGKGGIGRQKRGSLKDSSIRGLFWDPGGKADPAHPHPSRVGNSLEAGGREPKIPKDQGKKTKPYRKFQTCSGRCTGEWESPLTYSKPITFSSCMAYFYLDPARRSGRALGVFSGEQADQYTVLQSGEHSDRGCEDCCSLRGWWLD